MIKKKFMLSVSITHLSQNGLGSSAKSRELPAALREPGSRVSLGQSSLLLAPASPQSQSSRRQQSLFFLFTNYLLLQRTLGASTILSDISCTVCPP